MLTPAQNKAAAIKTALDNARTGRATLVELAQAHDLAMELKLSGCVTELRQHIAARVAPAGTTSQGDSRSQFSDIMGDVIAGIMSGIVMHKLIG